MERLRLDVAVVQVDDGHQANIGDWLQRSPRFASLNDLAARINDTGRQPGIWTAPFLVGAGSMLARDHPDWLVEGAVALHNWSQDVAVLDVTHPDAAEHLRHTYRELARAGYSYHKIDFLYAGALEGKRVANCSGLDAYAEGLRIIREGVGPAATLLGCGAPLLPSIGRVDAMRVGPDMDPSYEPVDGDLSQPSQRSAVAASSARTWMHGRLWINDPDCLLLGPQTERRFEWASFLDSYAALMVSGDALEALDEWGLHRTRELLRAADTRPLPTAVLMAER
jgi:alpha-galactosidase